MMRKIVWTTLGAALIVVGITAAWTQTRTWRGGRGAIWFHHGPMGYVAHELDLGDTQKSQIKTIWEGERPNVSELLREFASEQKEMGALPFRDGAADEGRMQDITARQGATLAKLLAEKEKLTEKIYSQVLNPAQRRKAEKLRKSWSSHLEHVADRISNATERK
jgi:Spy/CpxP family protein refolding chaperone